VTGREEPSSRSIHRRFRPGRNSFLFHNLLREVANASVVVPAEASIRNPYTISPFSKRGRRRGGCSSKDPSRSFGMTQRTFVLCFSTYRKSFDPSHFSLLSK
jgi:hypothetical protein